MDIKSLNNKLADYPYVGGYTPSQADLVQLAKLDQNISKNTYPHVDRWLKHLKTFSDAEKKKFQAAGGDDDELDLFGSDDDEEAEKAKAERSKQLMAKKQAPKVVAKSSLVIDVKVWDDETDLNEVEKSVRKIEKDGLLWGASKKVPLAYGLFKLQIGCVVEDEKVSVDDLTEQIEQLDLVQSTDIAAFQKI